MDIGDWITLAAVIVALGIGVVSILHADNLRRKEYKQRLLDEIIDWAEGVANCDIGVDYQAAIEAEKNPVINPVLTHLQIDEWCIRLQVGLKRGDYISSAAKVFSKNIQDSVKVLIDGLNNFINSLFLCSENRDRGLPHIEYEQHWKNSMELSVEMNKSVKKVIEEATKAKLKIL